MLNRFRWAGFGALALVMLLGGCVAYPAYPQYGYNDGGYYGGGRGGWHGHGHWRDNDWRR